MTTSDRPMAYGRIMRTLRVCPAPPGADGDVARLREACATLVFAHRPSPHDRYAMTDAIVALADLVARGALSGELAAAIVDDLGRCAPTEGDA